MVKLGDIARLQPLRWLNDEIINGYGLLILWNLEGKSKHRAAGERFPLDVYYLNTFFWKKLDETGYNDARLNTWTKKVTLDPESLPS